MFGPASGRIDNGKLETERASCVSYTESWSQVKSSAHDAGEDVKKHTFLSNRIPMNASGRPGKCTGIREYPLRSL